jgi:hypothetical protein
VCVCVCNMYINRPAEPQGPGLGVRTSNLLSRTKLLSTVVASRGAQQRVGSTGLRKQGPPRVR